MGGRKLVQTGFNGGVKVGVVGVVSRVQSLLLHEVPEPLNEVHVGGVRRQEEQLDTVRRPAWASASRSSSSVFRKSRLSGGMFGGGLLGRHGDRRHLAPHHSQRRAEQLPDLRETTTHTPQPLYAITAFRHDPLRSFEKLRFH